MFKVRIKTKEGFKEYIVENLKELDLSIPNEGVFIDNMSHYDLIQERDKFLSHAVGMSYNTEQALKITKKLRGYNDKTN